MFASLPLLHLANLLRKLAIMDLTWLPTQNPEGWERKTLGDLKTSALRTPEWFHGEAGSLCSGSSTQKSSWALLCAVFAFGGAEVGSGLVSAVQSALSAISPCSCDPAVCSALGKAPCGSWASLGVWKVPCDTGANSLPHPKPWAGLRQFSSCLLLEKYILPHGLPARWSVRAFLKSGTPRVIGKKRFMGSASLALYQLKFRGFSGLSARLLNFGLTCFEELSSSNSYFLDFCFGFQALCRCFTPRSCCRVRMWCWSLNPSLWVTSLSSPAGMFPFPGLGKTPECRGRHIPVGAWCSPSCGMAAEAHPAQGRDVPGPQEEFLQPPGLEWCSWWSFVPATPVWETGSLQVENSQQLLGGNIPGLVGKAQMKLWEWRSWGEKLKFSDVADDRQRLLGVEQEPISSLH